MGDEDQKSIERQAISDHRLKHLRSLEAVLSTTNFERIFAERGSAEVLNPPMLAVLDTNWFRTALNWQLRYPELKPGTVEAAEDGRLRLFIAEPTYLEVLRKLPEFAAQLRTGVSTLEHLLVAHWLPATRVVSVADLSVDERVARIVDKDDVAAGQLVTILAPALLLANDKHFMPLGIPKKSVDPHIILSSAGVVRTAQQTVRVGMVLPLSPFMGLYALTRAAHEKLGIPYWVSLPATAVGGYFCTRWYRSQPEATQAKIRSTFAHMAEQYGNLLSDQIAREEQARRVLEQRVVKPTLPQTPEAVVLRRLAHVDEPVSAQTLVDQITPEKRLPVAKVRELLKSNQAAVEYGPGRWMLGRRGGSVLRGGA
ncbi:MAG: PIN domain-containing protein [Acidimicrobiales bacterium]